jgi:virginiamycin B lyase
MRNATAGVICFLLLGLNLISGPDLGTATFSGTVTDEKGVGMSGVLIRLMNTDLNLSVSVITRGGSYHAESLPPGNYEVRAERKGFDPSVRKGVRIDTRGSADLVLKKSQSQTPHLSAKDVYGQFPEDSDKALMVDTCFRCHSMLNLLSVRKDRAGWERTVRSMYPRRRSGGSDESGLTSTNAAKPATASDRVGNHPPEEEMKRLINYFSKHFDSNRPPSPPLVDEPEPPIEGSTVVLREFGIPDQGKPEVAVPSMNSAKIYPHNITAAPDGTVWFAMYKANKIGHLDPRSGSFRSFPVPTKGSVPHGITYAADGSIWFTEAQGSKVGHLDPDTGTIKEIATNSGGNTIARDSKGYMYLTMGRTNQIGRVNTKTGESTAYDLLTKNAQPYGLIVDQKDQVWWCQLFGDSIGKLDTRTGKITEYPTPTKISAPRRLAVDKGGVIWFTEWIASKLGKLDPATGKITEYDLPTPASEPYEVAVDSEDTIWVAGYLSNTLARFDRAKGTFVEYPIPTPRGEIRKMAADPKQGIWFAESHTDVIGHIVVKR